MLIKTFVSLAAILGVSVVQGCTASHRLAPDHLANNETSGMSEASASSPVSPISLCVAPGGCGQQTHALVHGMEIGSEKSAPDLVGHPLTSVVVTQCNLVVAVYMTMPDGRFLRFDQKADVPAEQLVTIAYSATHSERVEVSCEGTGVVGYEKHEPV
jgi:hypothetical protein